MKQTPKLVKALKSETGLPVHFHTHDTSGAAAASVLAAIEAGCDAVDGALDALEQLDEEDVGRLLDIRGDERAPGPTRGGGLRSLIIRRELDWVLRVPQ